MNRILEFLSNPGVATLSNIILVVALVVVTTYYARMVARQTELAMKGWERPQIVEEVREVVSPLINELERNNINLDEGWYGWYHDKDDRGRLGAILRLKVREYSYFDLVDKNPSLREKILRYNKTLISLQEKLREIEGKIVTTEFKERCETRAREFNESRSDPYKLRGDLSRIYLEIVANIINNQRVLKVEEITNQYFKDFWNEKADIFSHEREREGIRALLKESNNFRNELLELGEDIVGELEGIREKYRKYYKLVREELEAGEVI